MLRNSHLEWTVPYESGVLAACGYTNGCKVIAEQIETTGEPAVLALLPDRSIIQANMEDVSVITVQVEDTQGRIVPTSQSRTQGFYQILSLSGRRLVHAYHSGLRDTEKNVPDLDYKSPLLMKNARLVDVTSGQIMENAWVIADKGMIIAQGSGKMETNHQGLVFDLKGRYLIPGLIDAHCHSTASPVFSMRMMDFSHHYHQQKQNFVSSIESGVTTIRDMGAFPVLLHMFIRDIEKGSLPGPRVVYCNSILNVMGSHPEIPRRT